MLQLCTGACGATNQHLALMSSVKAKRRSVLEAAPPTVPASVQADAPTLVRLLGEFTEKVSALRAHVQELTQRILDGELHTSKGISFLEVKSHLLLQYCANLGCLLLLKLDGRSIVAHVVVSQLITLRVYLEKMRPIDAKLRYQVDKMLKTATVGNLVSTATNGRAAVGGDSGRSSSGGSSAELDNEDPLHFRPNPAALLARTIGAGKDVDDDDDDDGDDDVGVSGDNVNDGGDRVAASKSSVYRPPMMEAVYYHEDERSDRKINARRAKELQKVASSSMMQQLREEFSDRPSESRVFGVERPVEDEMDRVRTEYEEDNMIRLPVTRVDKRKRKQQARALMGGGTTLRDEFREQFEDLERINRIRPARGGTRGGAGGRAADVMNALDAFRKGKGVGSGGRGGGQGRDGGRGGGRGGGGNRGRGGGGRF